MAWVGDDVRPNFTLRTDSPKEASVWLSLVLFQTVNHTAEELLRAPGKCDEAGYCRDSVIWLHGVRHAADQLQQGFP